MRLPRGEIAIVDVVKFRDYCLSPAHLRGRHKVRVFASVLGLTPTDAEFLREELLRGPRQGDATEGDTDEHGVGYIVRG